MTIKHALEGRLPGYGEAIRERATVDDSAPVQSSSDGALLAERLQRALCDSCANERFLAGLLESVMDAIVSIDEHQRIVLFNPAAEQMFGLPAADALGQPIELLLAENSRLHHAEQIRRFAASGVGSRAPGAPGRVYGRRGNGEQFPAEVMISQVKMPNRTLFIAILRDISPRLHDEQVLRDSQASLNRAQSLGQIGSWRLDLRSNQLDFSDESHRIFGIPKGTPLSYETFLACVHPDDREYVDRMWTQALQGVPYDIEHRLVVNGAVKWVRERVELEFDDQRRLQGGFGTTQDITELKRAEQALLEADRRKDEFLAMLAHELRNPLVPILNAAHVLDRLPVAEPQLQWAQQVIEQQVNHLTRLVEDLLDVSRIARGKIVLKKEVIELSAVVKQALEMARPLIECMGHRLDLSLPAQPVYLEGDPVRLAQVLLNLLDNAAKYTPNGGSSRLEASVDGSTVQLRVSDTGVGIPAELLPQLFELFRQGERTLDRSQGGLGIGLTVVKQLVERHGGWLQASSAGEGQGASFTISLPRRPDLPTAVAGGPIQPARPGPGCCRVLVVDDDAAVADSMRVLLQIDGHEVKVAVSGEAALELARSFHPQLVLLDIGLQGMDGYTVARQLRAQHAVDETARLVAVTGYGHDDARGRSVEAGFDRHLVKPVSPEALAALLAEIGGAQAGSAPVSQA